MLFTMLFINYSFYIYSLNLKLKFYILRVDSI